MIPYVHVPDLTLGSTPLVIAGVRVWPFPLHPFGLLVATGVLVGSWFAVRRARRMGYDVERLNSFITWMLVFGFVLSHMIDEVFYHPDEIRRRWWSLFMVWEGLSSFGGFIGALVGVLAWKYFTWDEVLRVGPVAIHFFKKRVRPMPILPFCDLIVSVFPVGWIFGRTGCSVVHDHPGMLAPATELLAVAYPKPRETPHGISLGPIDLWWGHAPRYDLGLLELMFTVILTAFLAMTWGRRVPVGTYVAVVAMAYAPVRLVMDFLRIPETDGHGADLRYGTLTFAQWCCIALFLYGLVMVRVAVRHGANYARGIDLAAPLRKRMTLPPPEPVSLATGGP